jgi:hypothetical protein
MGAAFPSSFAPFFTWMVAERFNPLSELVLFSAPANPLSASRFSSPLGKLGKQDPSANGGRDTKSNVFLARIVQSVITYMLGWGSYLYQHSHST